jgi:hypothetical protein
VRTQGKKWDATVAVLVLDLGGQGRFEGKQGSVLPAIVLKGLEPVGVGAHDARDLSLPVEPVHVKGGIRDADQVNAHLDREGRVVGRAPPEIALRLIVGDPVLQLAQAEKATELRQVAAELQGVHGAPALARDDEPAARVIALLDKRLEFGHQLGVVLGAVQAAVPARDVGGGSSQTGPGLDVRRVRNTGALGGEIEPLDVDDRILAIAPKVLHVGNQFLIDAIDEFCGHTGLLLSRCEQWGKHKAVGQQPCGCGKSGAVVVATPCCGCYSNRRSNRLSKYVSVCRRWSMLGESPRVLLGTRDSVGCFPSNEDEIVPDIIAEREGAAQVLETPSFCLLSCHPLSLLPVCWSAFARSCDGVCTALACLLFVIRAPRPHEHFVSILPVIAASAGTLLGPIRLRVAPLPRQGLVAVLLIIAATPFRAAFLIGLRIGLLAGRQPLFI